MEFQIKTGLGTRLVFIDHREDEYTLKILNTKGEMESSYIIAKEDIKRLARAS